MNSGTDAGPQVQTPGINYNETYDPQKRPEEFLPPQPLPHILKEKIIDDRNKNHKPQVI